MSYGSFVGFSAVPDKATCPKTDMSVASDIRLIGDQAPFLRDLLARREGLRLESVPRPFWDAEAVRHMISRLVISGHRCCGRPREVIVQHLSQLTVAGKSDID